MGFSHDPGDLPFTTIRRLDWSNRLSVGDLVMAHGEKGCQFPATYCRVVSIEPYAGECPAHLKPVYAGKKLVAIALRAVDEPRHRA